MFTSLSLRVRVLLFFVFMGLGGVALMTGGLFLGYRRLAMAEAAPGFVLAGLVAGFGLIGMMAGIWLLFDENVAKPIERLSATLRARAHAGVDVRLDEQQARYLGDLAPAARAVIGQVSEATLDTAAVVARETAHLSEEKRRLTALLSEIPVAMVLISPAHRIILYDGQAAEALGQIHVPRLNALIFDYLGKDTLLRAHEQMQATGQEVRFLAHGIEGNLTFDARLKPLGHAPGYMLLIEGAHALIAPEAERPLIYDFDLLSAGDAGTAGQGMLCDLTFVVFDTETTGLLPHKDEIVQIGAVRVVKGRIVPGEQIDQLVDPGVKIPPASTKVHKVTDAMVAGAPDVHVAASLFHRFASDSVIVAHNAPFDMAFLRRHAKASGLNWDQPILDTVLLSAVLFGASETHSLDALCDRLNVTIPAEVRHSALGDAIATAEALCKMLPMLTSRGFTTLDDVIEQTRQHRRLLEDLN